MVRFITLILMISCAMSCSRNAYYNTTAPEVNVEEANSLIKKLKGGTLIVQIPCEGKKLHLLQQLTQNESDPIKKADRKAEYIYAKAYVSQIQKEFVNATLRNYTFSKFVIIPDTLTKSFLSGTRNNIFLDKDLKFDNSIEVANDEFVMLMRGHRQYDYIYLHERDGKHPPQPMPYSASIGTFEIPLIGTHQPFKGNDMAVKINDAFANMNNKLYNFYESQKGLR